MLPRRGNEGRRQGYGKALRIVIMALFALCLGGMAFYYLHWESQPGVAPLPREELRVVSETPKPQAQEVEKGGVGENSGAEVPETAGGESVSPEVPPAPVIEKAATVTQGVAGPPPVPELTKGAGGEVYFLQAGLFSNQSKAESLAGTLSGMGYSAVVEPVAQDVPMIRVRLADLPLKEAREFLSSIKERVPQAFIVNVDGQAGVYAGSFRDERRSQSLQSSLKEQGIDSSLVKTDVRLTRHRVRVGPFPDQSEAGIARDRIGAAGLGKAFLFTEPPREKGD